MIELSQGTKEAIADILNVFPEVRWDRLTGTTERFMLFGWLTREKDLRSDFVTVLIETEPGEQGFIYQLSTSSAERSQEFCQRLEEQNGIPAEEAEHNPCQRVEDVFAGMVPSAISLTTEDPMAAGGDIAGPQEPHGHGTAIVSLDRAVMVDGIAVTAMHLERKGQLEELAIGLLLEGDINQSDPREHARILNLMGLEEVAGLICELQAAAHRFAPGLGAELTRLLEKRWAELETEGLTSA